MQNTKIKPGPKPRPIKERFWEKVDKRSGFGPNGDCWQWTSSRPGGRYGKFTMRRGVTQSAQVLAWELTIAPVPEGAFVCHRCDNPICVRPDHLFLGTAKLNSLDMSHKGRSTKGRKRPGTGPQGERNAKAKIDWPTVRAIRAEYGDGHRSHRALATKYGLGRSQIHNIVSGAQWVEDAVV